MRMLLRPEPRLADSVGGRRFLRLGKRAFLCGHLAVLLAFQGTGIEGAEVVVAGTQSHNLVVFDAATGESREVHRLQDGAAPRAVAAEIDGSFYVSLSGGGKGVVKMTPNGSGEYREIKLTRTVGNFGPGSLVVDDRGLWVAADTERGILLFDKDRGEELRWIDGPATNNIGLVVAGNDIYSTEYFQRGVTHYDLRESSPSVTRLVSDSEHLDRPFEMTIGHTGNLFVVNRSNPVVAEYDIETGDFVRLFADLERMELTRLSGIAFDPVAMRYYVAEGNSVFELDRDGNHLGRHRLPSLQGALGMDLVPSGEPIRRDLKIDGKVLHLEGIAGERYQIEASTDLVQWEPVTIVENLSGDLNFPAPEADQFDHRFYRLRVLE